MKKYGLIGFPLEHSYSPEIFREIFEDHNIKDSIYKLCPLKDEEELKVFFRDIGNYRGINVTIPYKQRVIPFMGRLAAEAEQTGAVNCVKIGFDRKPVLEGYNTDYLAFLEIMEPVVDKRNFKALILGTGGSSGTVACALEKLGVPYIKLGRSVKKDAITYNDLDEEIMLTHKLIINTTPLGMYPDTAKYPDIPYKYLKPGYVCVDLIYNPRKTKFLEMAETQGAGIINGELMLYRQAVKSFEIWKG
jgi:shikimate dehydrogenase